MKKSLSIFLIIMLFIFLILGILVIIANNETRERNKKNFIVENEDNTAYIENETNIVILNDVPEKKKIDDWRLVLVNYENELPENFEVELSNIDTTRQFDSRAIEYLNTMLKQMKRDGVKGIWVQSAYRSVTYQEELYDTKVQEIMEQGVSEETAKEITSQMINKPEMSEHNLGLAVDFNYVDMSFESTEAFEWLQKNAENYGFVLRYKKEKEEFTKVVYEPWHWRFVGVEHAIKMNELDMCLEEYVEYLQNNDE